MKKHVYSITGKFMRKFKLKKKINNESFTIISNNCLGGIIYNDLNCKFQSPTINLYIEDKDFLKLINNFEHYINLKMTENISEENYPIGSLGDIKINFLHYPNYETAERKWNERLKRVDFKNIFIVMTDTTGNYKLWKNDFLNSPFKNKILFVNSSVEDNNKYIYYIKGFEKNKGLGILWDYQNIFGKKYFEQFDFVEWFNQKK